MYTSKVTLIVIIMLILGCRGPKGDSVTGPSGPIGLPGLQGPQGNTGAVGPSGPIGLPGSNGSNGLDGTAITIVQFCNDTPSYPHTFPEVGLCINNQLYAVYSANDGFLTLVTPGVYLSNAIGSSCNFTVLSNCQIVR